MAHRRRASTPTRFSPSWATIRPPSPIYAAARRCSARGHSRHRRCDGGAGWHPRRGAASFADSMTTLAFLGDLMLGGDVGAALEERDPSWLLGDCLDHLRRADA